MKARIAGKKWLRSCLSTYISSHTGFKHYTHNKIIDLEADITKVDNFIINLSRDHYSKIQDSNNKLFETMIVPSAPMLKK